MKFIKIFFRTIAILLMLVIGYLNIALYNQTQFSTIDGQIYNQDVLRQLNFLKQARDRGEATKMQGVFPEGFMFFQALYGLTWSEFLAKQPKNTDLYRQGMDEINQTLNAIFSEEGTRPFLKELPLEYGVFYRGWSNYLLAQKLILDVDLLGLERYKKNCEDIVSAMNQSQSPYLESYLGNVWPADMMVAMASVNLYDEIIDSTYAPDVRNWVEKVKTHLDAETGLIPHSAKTDGAMLESARGSSQSLMLYFLRDIDSIFATQQFEKYQEIFLENRLGLHAIREYPKGIVQSGDIDSGPIIWDIGPSATIVGQKTYGRFGYWSEYQEMKNCLGAIGLSYRSGDEKKYLLGQWPMADVFLAWSNVSEPVSLGQLVGRRWRWKFQLISLALMVVGLLAFRW